MSTFCWFWNLTYRFTFPMNSWWNIFCIFLGGGAATTGGGGITNSNTQPKELEFEKSSSQSGSYSVRCMGVMGLLAFLMAVNVLLFYKLRFLELRTHYKQTLQLDDQERHVLKK